MANLTRKYQKIFSNASLNNGQFGSLQANTKITTTDPEVIQALTAYDNGWDSAIISGEELPSLQEFNGLQFKTDYQLAYLLQKGIAEWNSQTEYFIGDLVKEVGGSKIYASITDNNLNNLLTDNSKWKFKANASDIITTRGDLIRGSAIGEAERLALGSANFLLKSDGTDINWGFEVLDEDDMASNSNIKLATQQSIKAYVDTTPYPTFSAYLSANQAISASTETRINCDTESWDSHNYYDNSTNYRFTPLRAGRYLLVAHVIYSTGADVPRVEIRFRKNGTVIASPALTGRANSAQDLAIGNSIIVSLNGSTDYVDLAGFSLAAGNMLGGSANTFFQAHYLGGL